jgi:hypothetical protein
MVARRGSKIGVLSCLIDGVYVSQTTWFMLLVGIFNFGFLIGKQHNFGSFWHICQTLEIQRLKPCVYVIVELWSLTPMGSCLQGFHFRYSSCNFIKKIWLVHVWTTLCHWPQVLRFCMWKGSWGLRCERTNKRANNERVDRMGQWDSPMHFLMGWKCKCIFFMCQEKALIGWKN